MDEWATKEELGKELQIADIDKEIAKLVDSKFIEEKGGQYRINNQDGKGKERINSFLDELNSKYYPIIRHGYLHLKHKLEEKKEFPSEIIELSKGIGYDLNATDSSELLTEAEMFEIDEKTEWILKLTNNDVFKRNKPYNKVVLDCDLEIDNKWFKGILITDNGLCWTYWGDTSGGGDTPLVFNCFKEEKFEEHFIKDDLKKSTLKKLKVFICNFFDFINNPEARIIRIERSRKNKERRIKQGKEPLPSANRILISGTLKTYYDKINLTDKTLNYRFWVRGHFMRFWDKKKYNKLYKKLENNQLSLDYYIDDKIRLNTQIISKWKKPFIKGSGVLVSKKYRLEKGGKLNGKKEISKEEELMLEGLLALRTVCRKEHTRVEIAMAELLGVEDEGHGYYGHISDSMFEETMAKDILKTLEIKVAKKGGKPNSSQD